MLADMGRETVYCAPELLFFPVLSPLNIKTSLAKSGCREQSLRDVEKYLPQ